MRIEPISNHTMNSVIAIEKESFLKQWRFGRKTIEEYRKKLHMKCRVLKENGITIGYTIYEEENLEIYIHILAIAPKERGHGYGTAFINYLRSKDPKVIRTIIPEIWLDGLRFFKRRKFKTKTPIIKDFCNGMDGYEMYLEVDNVGQKGLPEVS